MAYLAVEWLLYRSLYVWFGSVAIVQLRDGNDHLSANCRQWIVQRLVQTATSELTRNDELVAKQSALEE
jgi:hypothetical protein